MLDKQSKTLQFFHATYQKKSNKMKFLREKKMKDQEDEQLEKSINCAIKTKKYMKKVRINGSLIKHFL